MVSWDKTLHRCCTTSWQLEFSEAWAQLMTNSIHVLQQSCTKCLMAGARSVLQVGALSPTILFSFHQRCSTLFTIITFFRPRHQHYMYKTSGYLLKMQWLPSPRNFIQLDTFTQSASLQHCHLVLCHLGYDDGLHLNYLYPIYFRPFHTFPFCLDFFQILDTADGSNHRFQRSVTIYL